MLGDLLGRGGMAEVFAGHSHGSHGFQKPVAIKRLLPELANDHVFVERLIGEAKLLISLQHGNIVSVLDLARDGEDVFLVMEFVDGPSLRQLLKARGPRNLPLGIASYVVQSAAAGLEFAHVRPGGAIIHADISPSNLLLTTSGEVRVADFGIARREGGGAGVVEGKWAYMAPEQARGESLTPRSDVFALGVVLYELITGQHPLGKQVSAEERDSAPIRVRPPSLVNPEVPRGLEAICMTALADNARDRYSSMQQMIDAIVDERYANAWRDGANDLARLIREITPGANQASAGPRTQVTDRPVTIMTRSLISESALRRRSSARIATGTEAPSASVSGLDTDSVEDTRELQIETRGSRQSIENVSQPSLPAMAMPMSAPELPMGIPSSGARTMMIEMPAAMRASTPDMLAALAAQAYRASAPMMGNDELASVHGGHTFTGTAAIDMRDARSSKWTYAILGVAALVGVIAAISISTSGEPKSVDSGNVVAQDPQPVAPTPPVVAPVAPPVAETVPTVTTPTTPTAPLEQPTIEPVAPAPAPAPSTEKKQTKKVSEKVSAKSVSLRLEYDGSWATAYINNKAYYVPGKYKLPAGSYTVKFKNDTTTRVCPVTLNRDFTSLKIYMEEGSCEVY